MPAAWHTITVPDAKPKIGASLAALGIGQYDGHKAHLRIGSGVDASIEEFLWDSSARSGLGGWVGADEHVVMECDDAWALDWSRQPLSAIRNAWARPNGGVSWQHVGTASFLRANLTIPASGSFEILAADYALDNYPPAGQVSMRGNIISYTGKVTTPGAKKLTGCLLVMGTPGVTMTAINTPIIPYAPATGGGGDAGGWGTTVLPLDHAGEMWAAGFRLEERMHAWMCGSIDFKRLSIAPFYLNYNPGEDFSYPRLDQPPVAGMLGPGITILGTDLPQPGIGQGTYVSEERAMKWAQVNWTTWAPTAPTKRVLIPVLYGKMPADAEDNGQAYGVTLALRWVQP